MRLQIIMVSVWDALNVKLIIVFLVKEGSSFKKLTSCYRRSY